MKSSISQYLRRGFAPKIFAKFAYGFKFFRYKCIRKCYCLIQRFSVKEPAEISESYRHSQRHNKKFVPSSFPNQFLYQKSLVIYFESFLKSELVNSMLSKENLSLTY